MISIRIAASDPRKPFDIQLERGARGPILQLRGEIDVSALDALEQRMSACHELPGVVQVDLKEVQFIDWPALRAILAAQQRRRTGPGGIELLHARGSVQRLLEVARSCGLLPPDVIVDTLRPTARRAAARRPFEFGPDSWA